MKTAHRTERLLSSMSIHLCKTAIDVCVVDLLGRHRIGFHLRVGLVWRRDISLRLYWIEVGGWTLGIATTYADFQIGRKNPSLRDALKIAASG